MHTFYLPCAHCMHCHLLQHCSIESMCSKRVRLVMGIAEPIIRVAYENCIAHHAHCSWEIPEPIIRIPGFAAQDDVSAIRPPCRARTAVGPSDHKPLKQHSILPLGDHDLVHLKVLHVGCQAGQALAAAATHPQQQGVASG